MQITKFDCFLQNAALLNQQFHITPLLYGSLGLEVLTNTALGADDIDILIPKSFVTGDRWMEFRNYLEVCGYTLIDEHEHTFVKDQVEYSYAGIEELRSFADIRLCDIALHTKESAQYLLLSLEQYLRVYERSCQDGYRINVKEKQDHQKIAFIKEQLNINR